MVKTLVSLGMSCQTAHQLARFAEEHPGTASFQKSPFDWLICPPASAAHWLNSGFGQFSEGDISTHRDHAYWAAHDLWFWHGFFTKSQDGRSLEITNNLDRERSKLDYQQSQFRLLDPKQTCFIVSNTQNNLSTEVYEANEFNKLKFSAAQIDGLEAALTDYFSTPVELQIVTCPDRCESDLRGRQNVHFLEPETTEWKGDDQNWDRLVKNLF